MLSKRLALIILIEHSLIIPNDQKKQLLYKITAMSDEAVDNLGRFLREEIELATAYENQIVSDTEEIIKFVQQQQ
jgi:hypothetical protein